jgi:hypothetical protein
VTPCPTHHDPIRSQAHFNEFVALLVAGDAIKRGEEDVALTTLVMLEKTLVGCLFIKKINGFSNQITSLEAKFFKSDLKAIEKTHHALVFADEELGWTASYGAGSRVDRHEQDFLDVHVSREFPSICGESLSRGFEVQPHQVFLVRPEEIGEMFVNPEQSIE